eukprot:CAMPEP_0185027974 /NCGR_PEP_ID=MMETSP1103-20130426/13369_1 /TAXON_ID=36769 /ORGANISM="Paraphysomonas bandaiensis, Strain Caron Lab Isolate" /LENGTH=43 /DNA_ID= /DNA_START= /DNA_END= /DNA_ORIENTATION=
MHSKRGKPKASTTGIYARKGDYSRNNLSSRLSDTHGFPQGDTR